MAAAGEHPGWRGLVGGSQGMSSSGGKESRGRWQGVMGAEPRRILGGEREETNT